MRSRRLAASYMILQAVAAYGWWLVLLLVPETRGPFLPPGLPESSLLAFLIPDIPLYIAASYASGVGLWRFSTWTRSVLFLHIGASWYGTLYCLCLYLLTGQAWLSVALMLPAALVSTLIAWKIR